MDCVTNPRGDCPVSPRPMPLNQGCRAEGNQIGAPRAWLPELASTGGATREAGGGEDSQSFRVLARPAIAAAASAPCSR